MSKKKIKPKLKFTYYNPNTPEKMQELLKDIIVKILLERTIEYNTDNSRN